MCALPLSVSTAGTMRSPATSLTRFLAHSLSKEVLGTMKGSEGLNLVSPKTGCSSKNSSSRHHVGRKRREGQLVGGPD